METEPIHSRGLGRSGPKRKTGCLTCRRRKVRCDEQKPVCSNCIRLRLDCFYVARKSHTAESTASTSPPRQLSENHALPYSQQINLTPSASIHTPIAQQYWPPAHSDHVWRFDGELSAALSSPFQDIFLSSIENFDPNSEMPYQTRRWTQELPSMSSDSAIDTQSSPAGTTPLMEQGVVQHGHDPERAQFLVDYFMKSSNPLAVILPTDTEWASARRSLQAMTKERDCVLSAVCALAALHLFTTKQEDTLQEAYQSYQASSKEVDQLLDDLHIETRKLKGAFASLFLLTRVELMAQTNSQSKAYGWPLHHLQNAHHRVHQHSDQIQLWRGISKRLLTWTTLLQTKAEYSAGITALEHSSEPLSHSVGDPFARKGRVGGRSESTFLSGGATSSGADNEDDTRTIAELAYDTLNQPAFDFFLQSQAFTSRVIQLDQYHRRRGTVDAEFEILREGQRISSDLHALWEARPATIAFLDDPSALANALRPSMARRLILNVRVYIAHYYAQFIYLHRVAYNLYPATNDVTKAIAEILKLACSIDADAKQRSRNISPPPKDAVSEEVEDDTGARLPGSMLWPLFLAAIEGTTNDHQLVLGLMREMDPHAVPNAQRTAQLLEEVLRRQEREGRRIDHRSVRKDLFDNELSVLY